MSNVLAKIKSFFAAEEVPRWAGLSLAGVLLLGLATVGFTASRQARRADQSAAGAVLRGAVAMLADRLGDVSIDNPGALQAELRRFSSRVECFALRVVDGDRRVLASISTNEIGAPDPADLPCRETPLGDVTFFQWKRNRMSRPEAAFCAPVTTATGRTWTVAGSLPFEPVGPLPLSTYTPTLLAGVASLLAFFLVYRYLRRHFAGVAEIGQNLAFAGDDLEWDLGALRVADALGLAASNWNRLIDFVQDLRQEVERSNAAVELRDILSRSDYGALGEALNALPDGILHLTDTRTAAYHNVVARRLLGLSVEPSDTIDLAAMNPNGAAAGVLGIVRAAVDAGGRFRTKDEILDVEADASTYRVRVLPLHAERAIGQCIVTVSDISQQVRAERAREEFVAQVIHELRTPLTNIRAYAETLSSGVFDDPSVISDCYNVITKETRRLSRLIEDMLRISQMEVGAMQLSLAPVDVLALVTEGVRDLRGLADEKNIDLQLLLPSKMEHLHADRDKLAVIINNLVGNALKYTPSGGTVVVNCKSSDGEVVITVKDSGIGIDAQDHERIFEKFQRGSAPEVQKEVGTGIGLTTAREIARRHGGDVTVMSEPGKGATFIVTIPRRSEAPLVAAP